MTLLGFAARLTGVTADLDVLLRRVAQRDVEAFAAFYDNTRARVFGLVTRVLRDPGYSEETTQDVYLQVWNNASNYDPKAGSPLAWLMTLAHRRAVDRVRSEQAASQRDSRYGAATFDPPADRVAEAVIQLDERRQVTRMPRLSDRCSTGMHPARVLRGPDICAGLRPFIGKSCDNKVEDARRNPRTPKLLGGDMTEPTDTDILTLATPYACTR